MKIELLVIGDLKSPFETLFNDYKKRLTWPLVVKELSIKGQSPAEQLKHKESELLLKTTHPNAYRVALDETGLICSSKEFADLMEDAELNQGSPLTFYIGGAHGHAEILRQSVHKTIAFGKLTWPHQMIRVMLIEQIYRAQQILKGHPYHK